MTADSNRGAKLSEVPRSAASRRTPRGCPPGKSPRKARGSTSAWGCGQARDCFLQQAVAGLSIGLLLIDPRGRLVWLNRAAERVLGLAGEACVGRPFRQVVRDPQLAEFWQESSCAEGNCMADVSVRWPRKLDLKLNATQCIGKDGREIGRALLFCDITSERSVKLEISQAVATRLLDLAAEAANPPEFLGKLTAQELRTLRLVGRGLSNEQIAEQHSVAVSTVRTHLKSVYRKLGLHSRAGAVSFAVRQHLV